MTSRNLAIVWAPNLIRPPRRDTDWTECGKHASIIESLILFFPEVFNTDNSSLSPVNEVSIDLAIENEIHKERGLSKHKSVCSLSPLMSSDPVMQQSNLKRSRSECADTEQLLLRLNIKDDSSDDDSSQLSDSVLDASHHVSLCQRHKKLVGTSLAATKTRAESHHHHQKSSETLSKIKRALCRLVSFRNGHYQVNDESVTFAVRNDKNPEPRGNSQSINDESQSTEHNYFQGKGSGRMGQAQSRATARVFQYLCTFYGI